MTATDFDNIFVFGSVRGMQLRSACTHTIYTYQTQGSHKSGHATHIVTMVRVNNFVVFGHGEQGGNECLRQEAMSLVVEFESHP